ncbi:hypothetical protein SprV_0100303500 [Sparganum proliferum]
MERGLSMFNGYIWNEYLVNASPDDLSTAFSSARIRMAEERTKCRVLVTNRVLNRLVPPAKLTRFAVVRVTGPDDESIALFNRLLAQAIPSYETRKEYPRRAPVSVLNQNEVTKIDWNALRSVDAPELNIRDLRADISDTQLLTADFENSRLSQYLRSARRERFSLRRPTNPSLDSIPSSRQTLNGYDEGRYSTADFSFGRPYVPGLLPQPEAFSDSGRFRSEYAATIGETARQMLDASLVNSRKTNRLVNGTVDGSVHFHSNYVKKRAPTELSTVEVRNSSKKAAASGLEGGAGSAEGTFISNTMGAIYGDMEFLHAHKSSRVGSRLPWSAGSEAPRVIANMTEGGSLSTKAGGINSDGSSFITSERDLQSSKVTQVQNPSVTGSFLMPKGQRETLEGPHGRYETSQVGGRARNMRKTSRQSSVIRKSSGWKSAQPGTEAAVEGPMDLEKASLSGSKSGSVTQGPETTHPELKTASDNATQKSASKVGEVGVGADAAMLASTDAFYSRLNSFDAKRSYKTSDLPARPVITSSDSVNTHPTFEGISDAARMGKPASVRSAVVGKGSPTQRLVGAPNVSWSSNTRTSVSQGHLSDGSENKGFTESESSRQAPGFKASAAASDLSSPIVDADHRPNQPSVSSSGQRAEAAVNISHSEGNSVLDGALVAGGLDAVLTYGLLSNTPGKSRAGPVPSASQVVKDLGRSTDKLSSDSTQVFNPKASLTTRPVSSDGGLSAVYSPGHISTSVLNELVPGIPLNETSHIPTSSGSSTVHGPFLGSPGVPVTAIPSTIQTVGAMTSELHDKMNMLFTPTEGYSEPPPILGISHDPRANEQLFEGWGRSFRSELPVGLTTSGGSNLNADGIVDEDPDAPIEGHFVPHVGETNSEISRRSDLSNAANRSGTPTDKGPLGTAQTADDISRDLHRGSLAESPPGLQHHPDSSGSGALNAAVEPLSPTPEPVGYTATNTVDSAKTAKTNISTTYSTKDLPKNRIAERSAHRDEDTTDPATNSLQTPKQKPRLDQSARNSAGGQEHTHSPTSSDDSAGTSSPTPSTVAAEASKFYADSFFKLPNSDFKFREGFPTSKERGAQGVGLRGEEEFSSKDEKSVGTADADRDRHGLTKDVLGLPTAGANAGSEVLSNLPSVISHANTKMDKGPAGSDTNGDAYGVATSAAVADDEGILRSDFYLTGGTEASAGGKEHTHSPTSSDDSAGTSSLTPSMVAAEASKFYADSFFKLPNSDFKFREGFPTSKERGAQGVGLRDSFSAVAGGTVNHSRDQVPIMSKSVIDVEVSAGGKVIASTQSSARSLAFDSGCKDADLAKESSLSLTVGDSAVEVEVNGQKGISVPRAPLSTTKGLEAAGADNAGVRVGIHGRDVTGLSKEDEKARGAADSVEIGFPGQFASSTRGEEEFSSKDGKSVGAADADRDRHGLTKDVLGLPTAGANAGSEVLSNLPSVISHANTKMDKGPAGSDTNGDAYGVATSAAVADDEGILRSDFYLTGGTEASAGGKEHTHSPTSSDDSAGTSSLTPSMVAAEASKFYADSFFKLPNSDFKFREGFPTSKERGAQGVGLRDSFSAVAGGTVNHSRDQVPIMSKSVIDVEVSAGGKVIASTQSSARSLASDSGCKDADLAKESSLSLTVGDSAVEVEVNGQKGISVPRAPLSTTKGLEAAGADNAGVRVGIHGRDVTGLSKEDEKARGAADSVEIGFPGQFASSTRGEEEFSSKDGKSVGAADADRDRHGLTKDVLGLPTAGANAGSEVLSNLPSVISHANTKMDKGPAGSDTNGDAYGVATSAAVADDERILRSDFYLTGGTEASAGGKEHTHSPTSSDDSAGTSSLTPSMVAAEASKFYADSFFKLPNSDFKFREGFPTSKERGAQGVGLRDSFSAVAGGTVNHSRDQVPIMSKSVIDVEVSAGGKVIASTQSSARSLASDSGCKDADLAKESSLSLTVGDSAVEVEVNGQKGISVPRAPLSTTKGLEAAGADNAGVRVGIHGRDVTGLSKEDEKARGAADSVEIGSPGQFASSTRGEEEFSSKDGKSVGAADADRDRHGLTKDVLGLPTAGANAGSEVLSNLPSVISHANTKMDKGPAGSDTDGVACVVSVSTGFDHSLRPDPLTVEVIKGALVSPSVPSPVSTVVASDSGHAVSFVDGGVSCVSGSRVPQTSLSTPGVVSLPVEVSCSVKLKSPPHTSVPSTLKVFVADPGERNGSISSPLSVASSSDTGKGKSVGSVLSSVSSNVSSPINDVDLDSAPYARHFDSLSSTSPPAVPNDITAIKVPLSAESSPSSPVIARSVGIKLVFADENEVRLMAAEGLESSKSPRSHLASAQEDVSSLPVALPARLESQIQGAALSHRNEVSLAREESFKGTTKCDFDASKVPFEDSLVAENMPNSTATLDNGLMHTPIWPSNAQGSDTPANIENLISVEAASESVLQDAASLPPAPAVGAATIETITLASSFVDVGKDPPSPSTSELNVTGQSSSPGFGLKDAAVSLPGARTLELPEATGTARDAQTSPFAAAPGLTPDVEGLRELSANDMTVIPTRPAALLSETEKPPVVGKSDEILRPTVGQLGLEPMKSQISSSVTVPVAVGKGGVEIELNIHRGASKLGVAGKEATFGEVEMAEFRVDIAPASDVLVSNQPWASTSFPEPPEARRNELESHITGKSSDPSHAYGQSPSRISMLGFVGPKNEVMEKKSDPTGAHVSSLLTAPLQLEIIVHTEDTGTKQSSPDRTVIEDDHLPAETPYGPHGGGRTALNVAHPEGVLPTYKLTNKNEDGRTNDLLSGLQLTPGTADESDVDDETSKETTPVTANGKPAPGASGFHKTAYSLVNAKSYEETRIVADGREYLVEMPEPIFSRTTVKVETRDAVNILRVAHVSTANSEVRFKDSSIGLSYSDQENSHAVNLPVVGMNSRSPSWLVAHARKVRARGVDFSEGTINCGFPDLPILRKSSACSGAFVFHTITSGESAGVGETSFPVRISPSDSSKKVKAPVNIKNEGSDVDNAIAQMRKVVATGCPCPVRVASPEGVLVASLQGSEADTDCTTGSPLTKTPLTTQVSNESRSTPSGGAPAVAYPFSKVPSAYWNHDPAFSLVSKQIGSVPRPSEKDTRFTFVSTAKEDDAGQPVSLGPLVTISHPLKTMGEISATASNLARESVDRHPHLPSRFNNDLAPSSPMHSFQARSTEIFSDCFIFAFLQPPLVCSACTTSVAPSFPDLQCLDVIGKSESLVSRSLFCQRALSSKSPTFNTKMIIKRPCHPELRMSMESSIGTDFMGSLLLLRAPASDICSPNVTSSGFSTAARPSRIPISQFQVTAFCCRKEGLVPAAHEPLVRTHNLAIDKNTLDVPLEALDFSSEIAHRVLGRTDVTRRHPTTSQVATSTAVPKRLIQNPDTINQHFPFTSPSMPGPGTSSHTDLLMTVAPSGLSPQPSDSHGNSNTNSVETYDTFLGDVIGTTSTLFAMTPMTNVANNSLTSKSSEPVQSIGGFYASHMTDTFSALFNGSTNAVLMSIHGTDDVTTAALHIVLGDNKGLDVLSVHDGTTGAFLRYTVSLLGYGFHGDILEPSENLRWMGPDRYNIAGAMSFLRLSAYRGRICFLPSRSSANPLDSTVCDASCKICSDCSTDDPNAPESSAALKSMTDSADLLHHSPHVHEPAAEALIDLDAEEIDVLGDGEQGVREEEEGFNHSNSDSEASALPKPNGRRKLLRHIRSKSTQVFPHVDNSRECTLKPGWKSVTGSFIAINAFPISCRCGKSPQGPAPSAHLGDGCLDLVIVHKCSHHQFLQYLILMANPRPTASSQHAVSADHLKLPFVEVHRVQAMEFMPVDINDRPLPLTASGTLSDSVITDHECSNPSDRKVSVWCVDGEIMRQAHVCCRVHRQLIRVFCRGPEDF